MSAAQTKYTIDGWTEGGTAFSSRIGLLFLEAPYIYRSPASPDLDTALDQGISQLYWQQGDLSAAIAAGKPGLPVVNLHACASNDIKINLAEGLFTLEKNLQAAGTSWVMVMAPPAWLLRTLLNTYQFMDMVVFYEWRCKELEPAPSLPDNITLGTLPAADMRAILRVDHASFHPIWQANADDLSGWLSESRYIYTLLAGGMVVAYLLAGKQGHSGHIFRLAVTPDWQGRGLGKWLMLYAMHQMLAEHVREITLNTQASNIHSRKLYEKLGYQLTGQEVTIYGHELAASDT